MHYFKRNIGEYHKKAGKLSMLEHGAYTLLMDACYDREKFPTLEEAIDWCWARTADEISAVEFVLRKFFTLEHGVYVQNRIREEIEQYHHNSMINKEIALKREEARRNKKARTVLEPCTNDHEPPPKQEPLTINQEPNKHNDFDPADRDRVPVLDVIKLFNQTFDTLPEVKVISEKRKAAVRRRWKENPKLQDIANWAGFFEWIKLSDFLMGRTERPWTGFCFDWLFNPANFAKIIEGNYHRGQQ